MSAFQPGDVIGRRYRLIELLGAGAMGIVWSARNDAIDRGFAIKLMRPDATTNPNRVQRFFREAKAAGRLRHRSIIEVYDIGTVDAGDANEGTPYLVMELLEGEPLDALLKRLKRLPVGTALCIVGEVARGLHRAHEQRIVHRDLKPGNLFLHKSLEEDGRIVPKILDFGVSKLLDKMEASETTIGTILGSPGYMAPEQTWGAEDLDGRADVWSLGVVLYKMLSGALPFEGSNFHAMLMAINSVEPKPLVERAPDVPAEVAALVHKCLEKKRENRFEGAAALAEAIEALRAQHAYPTIELAQVVRVGRARDSVKTATVSTSSAQPTPLRTTSDERTAPLGATHVSHETATSPTLPLVEVKSESVREDVVAAAVAESSDPSTLPRRARAPRMATIGVGVLAAMAMIIALAARARPTDTSASSAPPLASIAPTAQPTELAAAPPPADSSPPAPVVVSATPTTPATPAAPKTKPAPKLVSKPRPAPKKPTDDAPHEGILHAGF